MKTDCNSKITYLAIALFIYAIAALAAQPKNPELGEPITPNQEFTFSGQKYLLTQNPHDCPYCFRIRSENTEVTLKSEGGSLCYRLSSGSGNKLKISVTCFNDKYKSPLTSLGQDVAFVMQGDIPQYASPSAEELTLYYAALKLSEKLQANDTITKGDITIFFHSPFNNEEYWK